MKRVNKVNSFFYEHGFKDLLNFVQVPVDLLAEMVKPGFEKLPIEGQIASLFLSLPITLPIGGVAFGVTLIFGVIAALSYVFLQAVAATLDAVEDYAKSLGY